MLSLQYPFMLIFIPITFIIWIVFFREKYGYSIPNNILKKNLSMSKLQVWLWIIRFILITILFLIFALPQREILKKTISFQKEKIIIILDISRSMLAEDILPNRLKKAKDTIHTFLTTEENSEIWLIVFAWKAFVLSPFTDDFSWLGALLENINPYTIKQELPWLSWTAIWDALLLALETVKDSSTHETISVLLFTDGRVNIWSDPLSVIDAFISKRIPIFPIGIGTLTWSLSSSSLSEGTWSSFDEKLLMTLAEKTGWNYTHVKNKDDFYNLGKKLQTTFQREKEEITLTKEDYTLRLCGLFLILLLFETIAKQHILRKRLDFS